MNARKRHNREAGYIAERMNPWMPGTKVVIYLAAEQGIDVGGARYAVICDAHGNLCADTRLPGARLSMKRPDNFCDGCRAVRPDALRLKLDNAKRTLEQRAGRERGARRHLFSPTLIAHFAQRTEAAARRVLDLKAEIAEN